MDQSTQTCTLKSIKAIVEWLLNEEVSDADLDDLRNECTKLFLKEILLDVLGMAESDQDENS